MRDLLDVEGRVYRALSRWAELIMMSLIWWLLAVPVITAPIATNWLIHGVRQTRDGGRIPRPAESVDHLRGIVGPAIRLAGLQLIAVFLVLIALFGPSPGGWYGQLVFAVGSAVGVTFALVAPWSVVLLGERHRTAVVAIRAAYRRAVSQLSLAFLSAVAVAGGFAAVAFAPNWIRLIAVIAVPGLVAAIVTRLCDLAGVRTAPSQEPASAAPTPDDHRLREATS
jgi:hypothetical protein